MMELYISPALSRAPQAQTPEALAEREQANTINTGAAQAASDAGHDKDDGAASPVDMQAVVARLATLSALEYDREREAVAKEISVRTSTLDREVSKAREGQAVQKMGGMFPLIEPWPEAVNGAELLDDVRLTISRFIVCEPETKIAATLWIAFTWLIDEVQVAPLAVITAPEKRCGKTQLLDLIGRLSRRPLVASNISSAAVFRVIEAHSPTLLIDEADAFMRDNEELRGVINSGHTRTSAFVVRTVGDDHEPRQFSTWGAKAISGIGHLPETLMDRAVILELRRKLATENVQRLRHAEPGLFHTLARKLARFAADNAHRIRTARPDLPDALHDRAQDNWEALLAVADAAAGQWPDAARKAALKISGVEQETVSTGAELLADIRAAFDQDKSDRLTIVQLVQRLTADEMAPWLTYNRGKPISPRQLGKRLGEYSIHSRSMWMGAGNSKGFDRSDFTDTWARYLDASPSEGGSAGASVITEQYQELNSAPNHNHRTEPHRAENASVRGNILKSLSYHRRTDETGEISTNTSTSPGWSTAI